MPRRNASYLPQRSLLLDPQRNSLLARREGAPDTLSLLKNTGQWMRENPMDALAIGTAPIPVAGDVIGVANDLRHLAQNPSWGNLGWTALGALPFVPSGLGAIKRATRPVDTSLPELYRDNPGGDWLKGKIKQAKKDYLTIDTQTARPTVGRYNPTAHFKKPLNLSPNFLKDIPGAMGEETFRASSPKLKLIKKSIKEKGYSPEPIRIFVREDGQPFVFEGNHRLAEAVASGRKSIPVDIEYLRGGEDAAGLLSLKNLQREMSKADID